MSHDLMYSQQINNNFRATAVTVRYSLTVFLGVLSPRSATWWLSCCYQWLFSLAQ